jgi:hypothetical protein
MSDETKNSPKKEPAEEIELSNQDLEQVAGGGSIPEAPIFITHKSSDKATF